MLITGNTVEEHDQALNTVVERARQLNVKFNESKLQYKQTAVDYIGYVFSEKEKAISESRKKAILELKDPTNKKELQGTLGMINFIREFIPNLSVEITQLTELIKKRHNLDVATKTH